MENNSSVFITECPRDAMQGIHEWIPTEQKIKYINQLLKCGFDTLDVGSFVSPKAIPQMKDTAEVLGKIELSDTKLLTIVANERGAEDAVHFDQVHYLGYPFSISETFQQRNTNASIEESLLRVEKIDQLCQQNNKSLVLYLSMGFGNPYGDSWSEDELAKWGERLVNLFKISRLSLSDTIGAATPKLVQTVFKTIVPSLKNTTISAHLHTVKEQAELLTEAAYLGGCRHFEGALKGYGGCPMAQDDLVGNMPTERMIDWFEQQSIQTGINQQALNNAIVTSQTVFH